MKILVACRLMSGFVDSVRSGRWHPSGSPALYRLFDTLTDRGDTLQLLLTAKEAGHSFEDAWPEPRDVDFVLDGLSTAVKVLTGTACIPSSFGRWRGHLSDMRQTWRIWRTVRRTRPDLLYVDRANILAGALVARYTRTPVVLRVLGVTPAMKEMATGAVPTHRLNRWCYRAPFALVIGTDEGSGTRLWLGRLLRPDVARAVRVNGVDRPTPDVATINRANDGRLHIALVGRLDALKRCDEAVDGVLKMNPEKRRRIVLDIVGAGDRLAALRARVDAAGAADSVVFHGAVPHEQVAGILAESDLYISLNRQGNLSNANLEALAAGLGFILPAPDSASGTDVETHLVIPEDAAIHLSGDRLEESLTETLETLVDDAAAVVALRAGAARAAPSLPDWPTRLRWEAEQLTVVADIRPADIAIVIADLAAGGAQRVAMQLADVWSRAGRRVDLITLAGADGDFFTPPPAVRRRCIRATGASHGTAGALIVNLGRVLALRRALRVSGARTVVSFIGPTNVLTVLARFGLGVRLVISERNDPTQQSFGRAWDWLRRTLYRRADIVTANSHGALRTLAAFVPETRLFYLPNPVPTATEADTDRCADRVLAVGRLHRQKGFDILLDAFATFAGQQESWRLDILGDGPLRDELTARANRLGITDKTCWHCIVADPNPFYRNAAIFALPSRYEGTPNALLEAMAHGLAVIVSDASPGPLELVENNVNGLVVPAEDSAALAAAINRLAESPDERRRLGTAARARVAAMTPDRVLAAWDTALGVESLGLAPIQSPAR